MCYTAKKASDPNLVSPMTPASSSGIGLSGDSSTSGLGQDSTTDEFATPKGNTPSIPDTLPFTNPTLPSVAEDGQTDMLIKLTNDLNKAIRQRDINAFQYADKHITRSTISTISIDIWIFQLYVHQYLQF